MAVKASFLRMWATECVRNDWILAHTCITTEPYMAEGYPCIVFGRNRCMHAATIQRNLPWRSSEWSEQRLRLHGLRAGQCVTQHAGQSVARNVRSLFCWQNEALCVYFRTTWCMARHVTMQISNEAISLVNRFLDRDEQHLIDSYFFSLLINVNLKSH